MVTLDITEAEVAQQKLTPEHRAEAIRALKQDGFVVLNNVIDTAHLDSLRPKMLEDVEVYLKRDDVPFNFNSGNLQQDPPPFPPYLFRDILLNDLVIEVTKGILGRGLKNNYYSGNTNLPGSTEQPVHVDSGQLWPDMEVASPAYALVVNVPVVPMDVSNGSTEVWPGTHRDTRLFVQQVVAEKDIRVPEEALAKRRAVSPPLQPTVPAGGVVIRDLRLWHRGMPNHTQQPRPMIAMIHWVSWWHDFEKLQFPKESETFFQHSELHTVADFVDGPIDYIHRSQAYDYQK